jgi:hypothetical protein
MVLAPDDCWLLAHLLLGTAALGQLVNLLSGLLIRQLAGTGLRDVQHADSRLGWAAFTLHAYADDKSFLLYENVPQLAAQTALWVRGEMLLPASVYVASALGSTLCIIRAVWRLAVALRLAKKVLVAPSEPLRAVVQDSDVELAVLQGPGPGQSGIGRELGATDGPEQQQQQQQQQRLVEVADHIEGSAGGGVSVEAQLLGQQLADVSARE